MRRGLCLRTDGRRSKFERFQNFVPVVKKGKVQHNLQIYSLSISSNRTEIAPNSLGFGNDDILQ